MVAGGCIIVMEIMYKMDFSLPGFLICCAILGFGMFQGTFFYGQFLNFPIPSYDSDIVEGETLFITRI